MNATLNSPSHSIENSLLTYSPSSPAFARSTVHAAQEPPRSPPPIEANETDAGPETGSAETTARIGPASTALSTPLPPSEGQHQSEGQNHDRIEAPMEAEALDGTRASLPISTVSAQAAEMAPETTAEPATERIPSTAPGRTDIEAATETAAVAPNALERTTTASTMDVVQDDGDDESDDDPYEDNRAFLANLSEDLSSPNEAELVEIESRSEVLATNDDYWEKLVWEPLDDPEYMVGASGRIAWTISGFHGTADAPNRQRIMRSPKVEIGGYIWNIKLFPRGNEGTNQLSVYVECSGPVHTTNGGDTPMRDLVPADSDDTTSTSVHTDPEGPTPSTDSRSTHSTHSTEPATTPWQVAAQIGCVMYNPQEPRTQIFDSDSHCFEHDSQDWGWVRFHGPWHEIHMRSRYQRKPLLQNDTLAMTVFVRTIHDPTRALWWHSPGSRDSWDSLTKSGHRGIRSYEPAGNAMVAATAAWLHLKPFRDLLIGARIPNGLREPRRQIRPLVQALSNMLYGMHSPLSTSQPQSLSQVIMALDYYEYSLDAHSDVVEMWENLENLLNKELSDFVPEAESDVLKHFEILRQQVKPVLPQSSRASIKVAEAVSVQEVLNTRSPASKRRHAPNILHVELPRQRYDPIGRKWRRLTHHITLNEVVSWDGAEYSLYGMVAHQGELGTGMFYAVLRPYGPSSYWVQFGGKRGKDVMRLTRKQAIEVHEGRGMGTSGLEAVAYLAIYIKTSSLAEVLLPEPQSFERVHHPLIRQPAPEPARPLEGMVPVVVYDSAKVTHAGPGFVDPWTKDDGCLLQFDLPCSFLVDDLAKYLVERFGVATVPAQCRIWPMRIVLGCFSRYFPTLDPLPNAPNTTIGTVAFKNEGARFWLHAVPFESLPPPPPSGTAETNAVDMTMVGIEAPDRLNVDTPHVFLEVPHISIDVAHVGTQDTPVASEPATSTQDVVMGGTQEAMPLPRVDVAPARPSPPLVSTHGSVLAPPKHVYYFVKMFDARRQELRMLGSYMARGQDCIKDHLRRFKLLPNDKKCVLYLESMDGSLERTLKSHRTFHAERCPEVGCIIVIEEKIHPTEAKKIQEAGDAAHAGEYYLSMTLMEYFSYQGSRYVDAYFGGPYHDMPLKRGFAFGECVMIDITGNAYVGHCIAKVKSGRGTMYFANGDTYTGHWDGNAPHGEGTMVYGATQNRYVGGWKAGKRHGRGTMYFEVADEEAQLCKICFENDMDALFYRCGHVAACEACAAQVRDCPVCRRPVDAVVKMWKT